ncbi:MAG: autotransporter outer membrane beta-barrel domain-containing protein [Desulfovibrio sp.]|uniref:autotransporter outer membrane beta-barrel domain-containing protein n=1 Tax=Desulfovibrio sp. 7SRBS1 TaxID=3378064 RepID=UPI003B3FAA1C
MARSTVSAMMDASHSAVINVSAPSSNNEEVKNKNKLWVGGTLISNSSFSDEDFGGEGGVGVTHYFANGMSLGGGVFSGRRSLDTSYGGNQDSSLIGPGIFFTYSPATYGLRLEGGGMWHYLDMDLERGYQNGASLSQSKRSTQGQAFSLFGRIGWAFPIVESITLQPFAQYNWEQIDIDSYTESGGPFPAHFDSRTEYVNQARLGLEVQYACNENLDLWTWAAWSHRFEDEGVSMSGQLTGLFAFNYGGVSIDQDWGDAGVGVKWRPWGDGFETFSRLGFGIDSQDDTEPDVALTVGLSWAF